MLAELGRIYIAGGDRSNAIRVWGELLERFAAPERPPQEIVLPIDLVVRISCGCGVTRRAEQKPSETTGALTGA